MYSRFHEQNSPLDCGHEEKFMVNFEVCLMPFGWRDWPQNLGGCAQTLVCEGD